MSHRRFRPCDRCGRRARSLQAMTDWNVVLELGVIISLLCPDCQTPEENAEAAINEATLDYAVIDLPSWTPGGGGTRIAGIPKRFG